MDLRDIALKNIWRRKGKTILVVIGIALGIASLVAILTLVLSFQREIDNKLASLGYNIVVHPLSSNLSLDFGGIEVAGVETYETVSLSNEDAAKIRRSAPGSIKAISPKLLYSTKLKNNQVLFAGTDLEQEAHIKPWWGLNAKAGETNPAKLVAGYDVAKKLVLAKGDVLKIGGSSMEVAAILRQTGSQDDGIIFADIETVRQIRNNSNIKSGNVLQAPDQAKDISVIEIALARDADVNAVIGKIRKALPYASITSIEQAVQYREKAVGSIASFGLMITAAIVLISGFIVFFIMSSSVSDRRREIGIFRAVGYRQSVIARIILMEAFFQSAIAGAIGYAGGFGLLYMLQQILKGAESSVIVSFPVLLFSLALAISVGTAASLPATLKAIKVSPAEAMKDI
ncbi:MAG: ABC transporter permease [Rubrobacteridae bacterium]|nr:ABC transporter permease [Rubrobacteridae bacterium]